MQALKEAPLNIREFVSRALAETETTLQAAKKLEGWARDNPELLYALTAHALPDICYEKVRYFGREGRRELWAPVNDTSASDRRLMAFAKVELLDFTLPGGVRLRNATASDLHKAIAFYTKQASNMSNKAKWLKAIAVRVGKKTVEQVFTNAKLRALQKEV